MNKILIEKKNIYIYIILKWKEQEEIVNVNDDEENFSEEISLQNDKYDNSIDLDMID